MLKNFDLTIITPENTLFTGAAVSLVVPAELGYLGVLANHAPLAANLVTGKIHVSKPDGKRITLYSSGMGFLEVKKNNVTVFVRSVGVQN